MSLRICPLCLFNVSGLTPCGLVWLVSSTWYNIVTIRSRACCVCPSFLSGAESPSVLWIRRTLFIHPHTGGHLGRVPLLRGLHSFAPGIRVHTSECFRLRRTGTLGSHCGSVFHFLRNHQSFFHISCPDTPTSQAQGSAFSTSWPPLLFWILAPSCPREWEVASHRGSDSHRPDGRIVSCVY